MSGKTIKRKALSIEDKIKILKEVESNSNITRVEIAKKLNLPVTTLNGIVAKRDLIFNSSDKPRNIKKVKKGKYGVIEEELLVWFKQARSANIPIRGPILREKAEEIAKEMNIKFAPSNGWIDRMKKRAGLSYNSITDSFEEYVSVDDEVLPCEMLEVDICEIVEDEKMNETDEKDVPSFSDAVKGLETFRRFIESVENVPDEVFKSLRVLDCYQLKIAETKT